VNRLRGLEPGVFAMVMATGIVAVDLLDDRLVVAAAVLAGLAAIGYGVLVALTLWRVVSYRAAVRRDFADPRRGFGFFTFVAATDVLGTLLVGAGWPGPAVALLAVGALAWSALGYAVPLAVLVNRNLRPVAAANGTWFLWVVGVQSVAVLAASVQPATGAARPEFALLAVASWSIGVLLYAAVALVVAAALIIHPPDPADLAPPYWIAMGATAITAVAGGRIAQMTHAPAVDVTRGLVAAASLVVLAFGTWLIPPLLALGWWRHVRHRIALRYETGWWSIVFPLGMYAAAGHDLGSADHLPLVRAVGSAVGWLAVVVWLVAFLAMLVDLGGQYRRRSAV
jgi:tellurite resistance protein TehA-like permease